ncbi:MAG: hypothetical protein ACE5GJ_13115 [Gemmatimonadota bacterium]
MMRLMRRLLLLALLIGAAYAGYRWGGGVFPWVEARFAGGAGEEGDGAAGPVPSPELAEVTLDRFERFRRGDEGATLEVGGAELSSLVRYAIPGILPPGVGEPTVELADGEVHVSARVAVDAFPRLPNLDQVIGMLPDTVLVEIRGTLTPYDQEHMALAVDRVRVARVPIPGRLVSDVLRGLGREDRPGLDANALPVPIPDGVDRVFIQGHNLVLVREDG